MTQVSDDGTNSYTYGPSTGSGGRITQKHGSVTEYFLSDALGSVRQLTDASGEITLAKSYAPYGEVLYSAGNGASAFAFTGEQTDPNGLTYLRARYYSGDVGRFLSRDTWGGDGNNPPTLNRWAYTNNNPINLTDPKGQYPLRLGYVEGRSIASGVGYGGIEGAEIVYDFATMTRARFKYTGSVGGLFSSIGLAFYVGEIAGFRYELQTPIGLYGELKQSSVISFL